MISHLVAGPAAVLHRAVSEHARVPVHVKHVEVVLQRLVVDPEHAVVEVCRVLGVVVELLPEGGGPVPRVQLGPVAAPPQVRPRVLQLQ